MLVPHPLQFLIYQLVYLSHTGDPVGFTSAVMLTVARLVVSDVIREATTNTQSKSAQHTRSVGPDLDQSNPKGSAYEV